MHTEPSNLVIRKILTSTPPAFSATEALSIAASHYGIDAGALPLVSERDQNFRLNANDGRNYTLKVSNAAEQLQVVDFQNRALLHVENRDSSIPLPRVIPALNGDLHCQVVHQGKTHFVRVLSWLDGSILDDKNASAALGYRLGRLLARLGLALEDFDHPGSNPPLLWDMKRASGLRDLLEYIEEPHLRRLIGQTLARFDTKIQPALASLRTQVIHNDMNPGNVLMDEVQSDRISGLIDFGDMVKSPLIIDLAVAAAYQLSSSNDPLDGALPMITGYHSIRPLQPIEMALLPDLIRTRLVTSLLIGSYRVSLFPENRDYLMISYQSSRNHLFNFDHLDTTQTLQRVRDACVTT